MSDDRSQAGPFAYRLFGLLIRSELELPELPVARAGSEADIVIAIDDVARDGAGILHIPGIARFQVTGGSRITVAPELGVAPRNVRLYLLGSAMGLLLHQRGLLPLHASAIDIDGKAVAFMGHSGAGKSTIAAWFHDQGFNILADDVVVVRFDQHGRAIAMPGMPRLRLWKEALELSGRQPADFQRSYAGDDDWEKYDVPLHAASNSVRELELVAIYCLEFGDAQEIGPLQGLATAETVFANTYRGQFVTEAGDPTAHWLACLKLVERTPVFHLRRMRGFEHLETGLKQALAHARAITAAS